MRIDKALFARLAFVLFWPALALVVWGELTPHPPTMHAPDKLLHFTAYFGLAGIATVALQRIPRVLTAFLALVLLGGALEIGQAFTGRDAEILDEVANALGATLGMLSGLGFLQLVALVRGE
jgi:VanZ family protein